MQKYLKNTILSLISISLMLSLFGCASSKEVEFKAAKLSELNGRTLGIITGSITDKMAQDYLPLSPIQYFSSVGDSATALSEGKIDAAVFDSGIATSIIQENDTLTYINEALSQVEYGTIFEKSERGKELRNDFNSFLKQITASGEITYLKNKWLKNNFVDDIPYEDLEAANGTFRIAVDQNSYPFVFVYNGKLVGYEIELAYLYCLDRGYKLDIQTYDFGGVLASIATGKVDAGMSGIIYSDERAENYYFSNLYASADVVCVIRKENATSKVNNLDDMNGKTLGVVTGGICDQYAEATIKNIEIQYFNSTSDMTEALQAEKVDAICFSSSTMSAELKDCTYIKVIGNVGYEECGYLFPKTDEGELLKRELNEFIAEAKNGRLLNELDEKWHSDDDSVKDIDYSELTGENGTLYFAVSSAVGEPAAYYKEDKLVGYDIDFIFEFAKSKGYDLEIVDYSFDGMLQAVANNKCDIAGSNVTITPERKQSALFSDPLYRAELVVCAYDTTLAKADKNLIESIANSFDRTFIKENRYELFISGILTTFIISFATMVFGLLLGIVLFFIKNLEIKQLNNVLQKLANLIGEMPTVVLLMIFYYVIFNNSNFNNTIISIFAFTIYFGFVVEKLLATCLLAIDKGQFEAAYALGYKKAAVYRRVIIPQLIPMFIPLFIGEVVSLIKATSIVGYIAVQDLTKVSDIIRSRTYEAFFPLIVITIIYILIIRLFRLLINQLAKRIDYSKRNTSNVLKGVKTHD